MRLEMDGELQQIYMDNDMVGKLLPGDRVRCEVKTKGKRSYVKSLSLLERVPQRYSAILDIFEKNAFGLLQKNGLKDIKIMGPIDPKNDGHKAIIEVYDFPPNSRNPIGRIVEILGPVGEADTEMHAIVAEFGFSTRFPEDTLEECDAIPNEITSKDWGERKDLRDIFCITIDPADAKDFDDAISLEYDKDGNYLLGVHIADVSHYVKPDRALDDEALLRATSVYFPRRVIPMLPEKLSNGLCSLNPDVDRLCMVCDMLINAKGEIHAYQFFPAVMHSHARFTYTEVAAILQNTRGPEAQARKALVPQLLHLHDVYRALLTARNARGAVDFETTETQIVCDESGRIEKIVPRTRNDAHKLIEEAMLAANVCSAEFIAQGKQPGLFRVHEGPTPEKQETLRNYLKAMGVPHTLSDNPSPGEFQHIANATKERPEAQQIHTMLLRSMQQAIYTPVNSGHFGLAYEAYTHFTSPIRRYPDLLVHRVIKAILLKRKYQLPALPTPGEAHAKLARRLASRVREPENKLIEKYKPTPDQQAWEAAGLHCSANERRADEASRDVEAWLKCKYMREHLGEEYGGVVTAATGFGLFVTLDAMYVEGLVHITELGGEYFRFDEMRQELRGERTGIRYGIGSRVRIQVSRVDLDGRKIDFRLVREADELLPRHGKDASGSPMQNFKTAVKKAFTKMSGKGGRGEPKSAAGGSRKSSDKKASAKSRRSRK